MMLRGNCSRGISALRRRNYSVSRTRRAVARVSLTFHHSAVRGDILSKHISRSRTKTRLPSLLRWQLVFYVYCRSSDNEETGERIRLSANNDRKHGKF